MITPECRDHLGAALPARGAWLAWEYIGVAWVPPDHEAGEPEEWHEVRNCPRCGTTRYRPVPAEVALLLGATRW